MVVIIIILLVIFTCCKDRKSEAVGPESGPQGPHPKVGSSSFIGLQRDGMMSEICLCHKVAQNMLHAEGEVSP